MSLPKYEEYKATGLPLTPMVPSHWRRTALKYLGDYQNGYPFKPEDRGDEGLPIIRISQLTSDDEPAYFKGELDQRVKITRGDLLFSWSATIDSYIWSKGEAWLNQHIFKVTESQEASKDFLYYVIKHIAPKLAEFDAHGSTMRHIKKESLGEKLYIPLQQEQLAIVSFLARETAKIDALVAEQQRLIELLQEKKQAVISHAVTKGLNPNAPMKESGVEWLGEVPEHWELMRGRFLYMKREETTQESDEVITAFRDGQVIQRNLRRADGFTLAELEVGYQHVCIGDLVIHGMDAFAGAIGVSESEGKCTPEYSVCYPIDSSHSNEYFAHALRVMAQRDYIYVICPSVRERAPRFRFNTFKDVVLPVPPPDEQASISKSITDECSRLSELASSAESLMAVLKERRSALISAAVTGQIDVRGMAQEAAA